jgi:hypothetical protein
VAVCPDLLRFTTVPIGDNDAASRFLCEGLSEAMSIGVLPIALDVLAGQAQLRVRAGDYVHAAELMSFIILMYL